MNSSNLRFTNLVLYSYWRSSCSWRCRLTLNLLKIQYHNLIYNYLMDSDEQQQHSQTQNFNGILELENQM